MIEVCYQGNRSDTICQEEREEQRERKERDEGTEDRRRESEKARREMRCQQR